MPDSTFEDMWLCASCTVIRMCLRRCDIRRSVCDCVVACAGRFFFLRQLAADCCACCMRNRGWVAYHRQCQLNVSMSLLGVRNCMPTALYNSTPTPGDKKATKKPQNFFSSVWYRLTTAPHHHELEGSVCLFFDLRFFCRLFIAGG